MRKLKIKWLIISANIIYFFGLRKLKKAGRISRLKLAILTLIRAALMLLGLILLALFVGYHLIFIDHNLEGGDDV